MAETEKIEQISAADVINIALDTIKRKKQALVFVNTKRSAEKTAEDIALKIKSEDKELNQLSEQILKVLSKPTRQCERLARCIKKGIAFHHAGLHSKQKAMIEDSFRNYKIKIICCTPTLAFGLDLPAFRAILKDLKRYGHRGLDWIPVLEYHQMAGRAGRPKFDKFGEAIAIAKTENEKEEIIERYVKGEPEEIYSKLAVEPVLRTYLLSLIATGFVKNKEEIMNFFSKTFWAFQYEDMNRLQRIITKMLNLLEEHEFIRFSTKEDFVDAEELSQEKIKPTALGKRVAELYVDPLTAHKIIENLKVAMSKKILPFSFLHMTAGCLEIRPLLRVKSKEFDDIEQKFVKYEDYLLEEEPDMFEEDYGGFLNEIKTALFMQEWTDEKDEDYLLEKFDIRPGEIRVKLDLADWLLYCAEELGRILQFQPLLKELGKLRYRIKHGIKEELIALTKLENIGRVRARMLFNNGIKDIGDVKRANIATLAQLLGKNIAIDMKKQVGQDIEKEKVPERKRKGQISLVDY